ncbi:MAG: M42 family metallopeptidase [Gaiellaceae bacterium]
MNAELLMRVSNAPGLSGFEDEVQAIAAEIFDECCDETTRDRLGNVIGIKRATLETEGDPLRVVLAAHADEIGMMVKSITDDGFIAFAPVGGLHVASTMSQPVIIHGRSPVRGVVVPDVPPKNDYRPLAEMLIDVGLPRAQAVELVDVGDPVTFAQSCVQLNDDVFTGRNFDDRIGTYCLLQAMLELGEIAVDAYAVSTVQEEVGVRGAGVAAYAIEPDIGIAIDGSLCRGAYAELRHHTCEMGDGTGIYLMDNLTIGDRRLNAFLFELCERHGIPFQKNVGGGTDASALQRTKRGSLATTVGAPVRYMHSTVQLCHSGDVDATVMLLKTFLEHAHELQLPAR